MKEESIENLNFQQKNSRPDLIKLKRVIKMPNINARHRSVIQSHQIQQADPKLPMLGLDRLNNKVKLQG